MKVKFFPFFLSLIFLLIFIVFFKGLNKSNIYVPDNIIEKKVRLLDDGKSFIFDKKWNKVFLHSKTVNDFHVVDKQKLFALNFSATQELDRQQQADKEKIAELETKVSTLESALETVLTRLTELENK